MEHKKRLRPDQRVRKQAAFKNLIEKGKFARGEYFYLWAVDKAVLGQKTAKQQPALGVVVARRFDARATKRNEAKRRIREIFRKHQHELDSSKAFLVKVKEQRKATSFPAMEKDLLKLFKENEKQK